MAESLRKRQYDRALDAAERSWTADYDTCELDEIHYFGKRAYVAGWLKALGFDLDDAYMRGQ